MFRDMDGSILGNGSLDAPLNPFTSIGRKGNIICGAVFFSCLKYRYVTFLDEVIQFNAFTCISFGDSLYHMHVLFDKYL